MEKYSQFRDPLTGTHPFTNPSYPSIHHPISIFHLLIHLICLPLLLINNSFLKYIIKINYIKKNLLPGTYAVNYSSFLDPFILKYLYKNCNIYKLTKFGFKINNKQVKVMKRDALNFVFVEECGSNNSCVLRFVRELCVDGCVGLKYSKSCIYMYGNRVWFFVRFMCSYNVCDVNVVVGGRMEDLVDVVGGVKVDSGKEEYDEFYKLINKK